MTKKSFSEKLCKSYKEKPVPKSLFNKRPDLQAFLAHVLSCESCENFSEQIFQRTTFSGCFLLHSYCHKTYTVIAIVYMIIFINILFGETYVFHRWIVMQRCLDRQFPGNGYFSVCV